jgi:hypothetical protein
MELIERAQGKSLTSVAKTGVGGWLLAVSVAAITGVQQILDLMVVTPVDVVTDIARTAGDSLVEGPLGIVDAGSAASANDVGEFGFLAVLVAIALVLASLYMVSQYLEREDTSDLIPGIFTDVVPFVGVDEEEET